jgi:hypothetical protein
MRPATMDDCGPLAARLREEDAAEAYAASGIPAEYSLRLSLLFAPATVACVEGQPEMIFGCGNAQPWMLCTPLAVSPRWRKCFVKHSRYHIEDWQAEYPLLHNFTDARNSVHHAWLRRVGFTFIAFNVPYGPFGLPFHQFVRTTNQCADQQHP